MGEPEKSPFPGCFDFGGVPKQIIVDFGYTRELQTLQGKYQSIVEGHFFLKLSDLRDHLEKKRADWSEQILQIFLQAIDQEEGTAK